MGGVQVETQPAKRLDWPWKLLTVLVSHPACPVEFVNERVQNLPVFVHLVRMDGAFLNNGENDRRVLQ